MRYFTHHLEKMFLFDLDMTKIITLKASYGFIFHREVLHLLLAVTWKPVLFQLKDNFVFPCMRDVTSQMKHVVSYFHRKK